jgi:phytoene dehydrogenase-like protein
MGALFTPAQFDAIVVGSGISGLTAGLHLQRAGIKTLIVERRTMPGGLCGTFTLDGHDFVIGCNDFGDGLPREFAELGVDVEFLKPKTAFFLGHRKIDLPPDRSTMLTLGRRIPGLVVPLFKAWQRPQQTMGQFIDGLRRDQLLADLACVPAYGMLRSPDDVTIADLRENFSRKNNYGYEKSRTPAGGPRGMVDAMVRRFERLGGQLRLNCECLEVQNEGRGKRVHTSGGTVHAGVVLSSQGRWEDYPPETKPGIEIAFLLMAVRKHFPYPRGYHTIGWFQPRIAEELRRLDAGLRMSQTSFHIFRSDLPEQPDHYTINAVIPLPRGERDPTPERRSSMSEQVLGTLEVSLPGFRQALTYHRFLSPAEYEEQLGLRNAPSPYVPPCGFRKPSSYDPIRDLIFVGTSVGPPGEHAGAAVRSGRQAAYLAIERLTAQQFLGISPIEPASPTWKGSAKNG